jgi:hypothetical protein
MSRGRRVSSDRPEGLHIPVRLFDRVRAVFGLPEMPVIVADEIARQIDAMPDAPAHWSPPPESYGCVAPPFARWFIEVTTVSQPGPYTYPDGKMIDLPGGTTQRGVACYDISAPDLRDLVVAKDLIAPPAGTRWVLALWAYQYLSAFRMLQTHPGPMFVHLDAEGHILDDTSRIQQFKPTVPGVILAPPDTPPGPKLSAPVMPQWAAPNHLPYALKALSAMHQRCPVERVEPGVEQRRRAERKERVQLHDYYLLKVKSTRPERLEDFARIGQPERARPREHRVRGHFRWYGDTGLFGKHRNRMVWVPEHERGTDELGTIRKDYEVTNE